MAEENNKSILRKATDALHMTTQTFITIVSVVVVVSLAVYFCKEMFFSNPVRDIYTNWDDITYISEYYDEDEFTTMVSITIESTRGMPYGINVSKVELSQSNACPIIMSSGVDVPTMKGKTLVLPYEFDSVFGYVKEYHKQRQEGNK